MSRSQDIVPSRDEIMNVINFISREAATYLSSLDDKDVRGEDIHEKLSVFEYPLPESGVGALKALEELVGKGLEGAINSSGPRFFHFVTGGITPAALGADWLTTTIDQMAYAWIASPIASKLELICISWLKELFELPQKWGGVITTGTTMANFVGLSTARQWWGKQYGIDIAENGLNRLPDIPIFSSNLIHPSTLKALGMMGIGRASVKQINNTDKGLFDLEGLEVSMNKLNGKPSIIIATAGEPNAGLFDPIEQIAQIAQKYNTWLHVDGAFGLFARLSNKRKNLIEGVEKANSVVVDGHKWLNVPYDCGFAFVSNTELLGQVFTHSAEYLPSQTEHEPVMGMFAPEMSRRARALPVWATLKAYGRNGIAKIVENHLNMAEYLAGLIEEEPNLELLNDVKLNVVCFRYKNNKYTEANLNLINEKIGKEIIEDGRIYVGTTKYKGKIAFRPAIANWRTRFEDVKQIVVVITEIAEKVILDINVD